MKKNQISILLLMIIAISFYSCKQIGISEIEGINQKVDPPSSLQLFNDLKKYNVKNWDYENSPKHTFGKEFSKQVLKDNNLFTILTKTEENDILTIKLVSCYDHGYTASLRCAFVTVKYKLIDAKWVFLTAFQNNYNGGTSLIPSQEDYIEQPLQESIQQETKIYPICEWCGEEIKNEEYCIEVRNYGNLEVIEFNYNYDSSSQEGPFHQKCAYQSLESKRR